MEKRQHKDTGRFQENLGSQISPISQKAQKYNKISKKCAQATVVTKETDTLFLIF